MSKYIKFDVENFDIVEEPADSQFSIAKIQAFSSAENRHDMVCSEEVLQNTAFTIYNKPILYSINKMFQDFHTHVNPEDTLIAGFVEPDSAEFIRLPDNRLSLNVIARIWKRYAPKFIDILKRDGNKKVSVEMELKDSEKRKDGLIEMKSFSYMGICLLGNNVVEASKGANLQVLSFSKEQEEYQKAFNSEFGLDLHIPDEIKFNVQKGFELYKKYNIGGTSVALSMAKSLLDNDEIDLDKIKYLDMYFSKQSIQLTENPSSSDEIEWCLFGGDACHKWISKLSNKIQEKKLDKFSEVVTMPYEKISEINPALKGITPSISLGQANEIAKQADAIGSDEKKNGWAIAISSFKKSHKIVNGKWVKMSENNAEEKEMAMEEEKDKKEEMAVDTPEKEKEETPEEEKKETPEEEKKEKEEGVEKEPQKEKMSLDQYLDTAAMLAMLQEETEDYRAMVDEMAKPDEEKNYALMCGKMFAKMCKMSESNKAYMSKLECAEKELEELRKFKKDMEDKQFQFAVDSTLGEVAYCVPEMVMSELKDESKKFSIDNIDAWKNLVKARAFEFAAKVDKEQPQEKKYGLPFADTTIKSNSIWTR